jgi:hypothetical protein
VTTVTKVSSAGASPVEQISSAGTMAVCAKIRPVLS